MKLRTVKWVPCVSLCELHIAFLSIYMGYVCYTCIVCFVCYNQKILEKNSVLFPHGSGCY